MTNHWSALSDGRMKYIYHPWADDEQLFNLTADPDEAVEIARRPEYAAELAKWRSRMVQQFEREGRGEDWVSGGKLVKRMKSTTYSPHYPPTPPPPALPTPKAGDGLVMQSNGGTAPPFCGTNDCWLLQPATDKTVLKLQDAPTLCLTVVNDSALDVDLCTSSAEQHFVTANHSLLRVSGPLNSAAGLSTIEHKPSGRCIVDGGGAGAPPRLATCNAESNDQQWIFGMSGRLCASQSSKLCLRAVASTDLSELLI
jgi:hypothetical protein